MMVVLPSAHPIAASAEIKLAMLKDEPLLMFPRAAGPTLFDSNDRRLPRGRVRTRTRPVGAANRVACHVGSRRSRLFNRAGFDEASSRRWGHLQGVGGGGPLARVALAIRRGESSRVVHNFVARDGRVIREPNRQLSRGIGVAS